MGIDEKRLDIPGYTVITRSMSAALATSSVIAVEGVSGEMATPTFIFRARILEINSKGLSRICSEIT